MTRIILAYSGSPATSHAIGWLTHTHAAEVVTLTLDLGQGRRLEAVRDRALATGASRAHVLDVYDEFAHEYFLRALRADALFANAQSLVGALSHPLLARKLVDMAGIEQADAVAFGCSSGDARIARAIRELRRDITAIPVPRTTFVGQTIRSQTTIEHPSEPALVEITFERGAPVAINAIPMPLIDLVSSLDIIAAAHGVGRFEGLETPAATVLSAAHRAVEDGGASHDVSPRYAAMIESGRWFSSEREELDAVVARAQERVAGVVRLKLFQGGCEIVDRREPTSSEVWRLTPSRSSV
jgi:argininosuccinate synthase